MSFFNDGWISRVKPEVGDNWRLKVSVASSSDSHLPCILIVYSSYFIYTIYSNQPMFSKLSSTFILLGWT